jgi:hypothetical protein
MELKTLLYSSIHFILIIISSHSSISMSFIQAFLHSFLEVLIMHCAIHRIIPPLKLISHIPILIMSPIAYQLIELWLLYHS